MSFTIYDLLNRDLLLREFGIMLSSERRRRHLSQAQFAARVGLSRTSVTNIERGRQGIQLHQLYIFASVLQIDLMKLLPKEASLAEVQPAVADEKRDRYLVDAMKIWASTNKRKPEGGHAR
jgi:transcriptional regulator with XRE-family HTH domain